MARDGDAATYAFCFPHEETSFRQHFSSLLLSGEWPLTLLEVGCLGSLTAAALLLPPEAVNVPGSMPLKEFASFLWTKAAVARVYNSYLEAVFFAFPKYRTQPSREHALKARKDLCGREAKELDIIVYHDRLTLLSQFGLNLGLYFLVPGYYPAADTQVDVPLYKRILQLLANHYFMSFGMYWTHRALHAVPVLWHRIHSLHHWAKHPLSRNTYQDHWMDNFGNALIGHFCAQVVVPLDRGTFWFSHIFRILESLEKHSGVCCHFNLAHQFQRWLPFAQMPHHHDWHHEGHKSANYTFCSLGGIWDCVFGTRSPGRAKEILRSQATARDRADEGKVGREKSVLDMPLVVLTPVLSVALLAAARLWASGGVVKPSRLVA